MKPLSTLVALAFGAAIGLSPDLIAAEKTDSTNPDSASDKQNKETEAAYAQSIEKRVADIIGALDLKDSAKKSKVHDVLIAQYRSLRDWHEVNDSRLKGAPEQQAQDIKASLKSIHDKFIAALSAELTMDQVEKIKDKMTYGTVKVTYDAYCEIVPNLSEPQKQRVLELLKEAREEAMDGGSHQEKAAIFKKYKGKINNYLDSHGHNVKQAYKDWGEKQKAKAKGGGVDKKD